MLSDRVVTWIAVVITVVWAAAFGADILVDGYATPTAIHGIMGLVAGGAFGERYVRRAVGRGEKIMEGLNDDGSK